MSKKHSNFRELAFSTTSKSLLEGIESPATKIRIYNFNETTVNISMSKGFNKQIIGMYDASWIRIYTEDDLYYDFLTSSVFFVNNKEGLYLIVDEDAKLLDRTFFVLEIEKFIKGNIEEFKDISNADYLSKYIKKANTELKIGYKELDKFYSLKQQQQLGRININDLFVNSKNELVLGYLTALVFKQVVKDNKEEILNLLLNQ